MTDRRSDHDSDSDDDAAPTSDGASTRGMPLWVKLPGVAVGVLVLLFVVLQMVGVDGGHGPRLHDGDTPSGGEAEPPSGGVDRREPQHLEGSLDDVDGLTPEELEEFFEDLHR